MLVGRKKECAMIERFLAGLTAGLSALLLEGEPGIGKTALLADAHAMADQLGYMVLSAFPLNLDRESDLTALADVMAAIPAEEVDCLALPQRRAVLAVARQADLQWRDPSVPTIAAALLSLLRGLSTKKPVLLLIDDLQWLDSVSADVLSFVLSRLRVEPVGLLAGVRAGWSGNLPPLATDHLLASRVNRLRLDALDLAELRELLNGHSSPSLSHTQVRWLHGISGGNPLLAQTLADRIQSRATPDLLGAPLIPPALRELMLTGTAHLDGGALDVLLVSAVSADPSLPVVCAAARNPRTAFGDLEAGVRAGVLAVVEGMVSFTHPLIGRAVAERASPPYRRAGHRRLATVMSRPQTRIRHQALAAAGPDERLAGLAEMATAVAAQHGASAAADELALLAVALTPLAQQDGRLRGGIPMAERQCAAADPERACQSLQDAARSARPGPGRAEIWRRLAWYRTC